MACIFDVAKYILEQKGRLPNPVLQELCRCALRDSISSGRQLFDEKYEVISSESYPAGEICLDLYYECSADVVNAADIAGGNSSVLTTEEKLIISETLNKCFDEVCRNYEISGISGIQTSEKTVQDNQEIQTSDNSIVSEENSSTRKFDTAFSNDEVSEPTVFFEVPVKDNAAYQEDMAIESKISEEQNKQEEDTEGFIQDIRKSVAARTSAEYAQNTMVMPEAEELNSLSEDYEETAPLNYTYAKKTGREKQEPIQSREKHESSQNVKKTVKPAHKKSSGKRLSGKKLPDKTMLICVMTVMIVLLIILIIIVSSGKKKGTEINNNEPEITKAATLPKPVLTTAADEEETEPVTEPETTSSLTVTETEASEQPEAVTTTEILTEPVTEKPAESEAEDSEPNPVPNRNDGKNILSSSVFLDVNRDGSADEVIVYDYGSDDLFYDIKFSDGIVTTFTFPGAKKQNVFDYMVYDKNVNAVYPACLNVSMDMTGISLRFDQINNASKFIIEYRMNEAGAESQCTLNNAQSSEDEIYQYYRNIEVMYSFSDYGGSEFSKIMEGVMS